MTTAQKRKVLARIAECQHQIGELKRARYELGMASTQSATVSGAQGSKSYTRIDIPKITELINELARELRQLRNLLTNSPLPMKHIVTVYS